VDSRLPAVSDLLQTKLNMTAQQWRIPTEVELQNFKTSCLSTDLGFAFGSEGLSPSAKALEDFKKAAKKHMVDIYKESCAPSVNSDYDSLEQGLVDATLGSP
jgi:hypothetical protein